MKKPGDKGITTKHSHHVDEQFEVAKPEAAEYSMYNITYKKGDDPICIDVTMNDIHVKIELDTGSGLTIINEQMYSEITKPNQLNLHTQVKRLTSWDQHKLWLITKEKRWYFQYKWSKVWVLNLLGRDWINQLKVSVGSRCNLLNSESGSSVG